MRKKLILYFGRVQQVSIGSILERAAIQVLVEKLRREAQDVGELIELRYYP